ncbi:hypothetical protein ACIRRA_42690 [Nocardia sp. NPDC101769]|uniref:hypothetical protein n=1 Tax=Nocardia sp. NPDC101769 TaxID=3364333 RepID=UPI0038186D5A
MRSLEEEFADVIDRVERIDWDMSPPGVMNCARNWPTSTMRCPSSLPAAPWVSAISGASSDPASQ